MNKAIKWVLWVVGGMVVLLAVGVVLIVMALDVDRLKPQLEKQVRQATGRDLTIGKDLDVSFFPWVGVAFSDLALGNPEGFSEPHLVSIKGFEARLKLMPLLRKQIQVKRFVVHDPRIVLEKNASGKANWELAAPQPKPEPETKPAQKDAPPKAEESSGIISLPLASFEAETFSITGGSLLWLDRTTGQKNEITDLGLTLTDLSLTRPVGIDFSARFDQKPVALRGKVGPVGKEIGKAPLPIELALELLETLTVQLKGQAENILSAPKVDMHLQIPAFSPRALTRQLDLDVIPPMADANALTSVAFTGHLQAKNQLVSLQEGVIGLDGSNIQLAMSIQDFKQPSIELKLGADSIDVDRYMPASSQAKETPAPSTSPQPKGKAEAPSGNTDAAKTTRSADTQKPKIDYEPLRKLQIDATVHIDALKVNKIRMQKLAAHLVGEKGLFTLSPFNVQLYDGGLQTDARIDVRKDRPRSNVSIALADMKAGPLVKDLTGKDLLEGTMKADLKIAATGDQPDDIKRSLNGKGAIELNDGAVVGIDLEAMIRNIESAFSEPSQTDAPPKTEFAQLSVPFTLTKGVFATDNTRMTAPRLRLKATGRANLVNEKLDFRILPEVVRKPKQDDDPKSAEKTISVPVLVAGTFAQPAFRPDVKAIAHQQIEKQIFESKKVQEIFEKNEELKPLQDTAKGLLKGLFGSD